MSQPDSTPTLPILGEPCSKDEITAELARLHRESTAYWQSFSTAAFFAPLGEGWSPADNVRHLTKSIRAVVQGLSMSKTILRLLFGRARQPSRSFSELRATYHAALAAGGKAGRFTPRPLETTGDPEADRARVMAHREEAAVALLAAIAPWKEPALDRLRLPHPLLGKLTVREMLLFTLYHNLHHVLGVERRRGQQAPT